MEIKWLAIAIVGMALVTGITTSLDDYNKAQIEIAQIQAHCATMEK